MLHAPRCVGGNVVTPANASVRTLVLFESLNNRSTVGRVPSVNTTGLVNRSTIRAESCPAMANLLPCQPAEQKPTKYDEQNIRKPDEQFRVRMRISTQRIADDDKEKISRGDDQTHGEPD